MWSGWIIATRGPLEVEQADVGLLGGDAVFGAEALVDLFELTLHRAVGERRC